MSFSPVEVKLRDMRVKYDFVSRNQRELTVTKGEIVDVSISVLDSQNNEIFKERPTNPPLIVFEHL